MASRLLDAGPAQSSARGGLTMFRHDFPRAREQAKRIAGSQPALTQFTLDVFSFAGACLLSHPTRGNTARWASVTDAFHDANAAMGRHAIQPTAKTQRHVQEALTHLAAAVALLASEGDAQFGFEPEGGA